MKIKYIDNKKTLDFVYCRVVEESDKYYAIYDKNNKLLTHQKTWKRATKIASLLDTAFKVGKVEGYGDCEYSYRKGFEIFK